LVPAGFGGLGGFGLSLGYERDRRVPGGPLHRVFGDAVDVKLLMTKRITTPRRLNSQLRPHTHS
jgi:hypothetical protein